MALHDSPTRKRAARAIDGALILLIVLLAVQVWLLMASVESWLAGNRDVALPAAILSGALFAGALGLIALARRTDKAARLLMSREARSTGSDL
jgi:hypothetical protein